MRTSQKVLEKYGSHAIDGVVWTDKHSLKCGKINTGASKINPDTY